MKKSFKKAGAAVLSMAMLLSMGAISMPVFAVNNLKPGQIEVDLTDGSKHADDKGHTYDYLDGVTSGTVKLYKVATLEDTGWKWATAFNSVEAQAYLQAISRNINGDLAGQNLDHTDLDLTDFADLLRKIKPTGETDEVPEATSEDMLSLASALARIANGQTPDHSATITPGTTAYLPSAAELMEGATKNAIGYYLIVTETSQADVTVQPSLVVLRNKETPNNVKKISLKGKKISVDKSIKKVADKDTGTSTGGTVISGTGNTAVVAQDDIVTYEINTQLPKYDALMPTATITNMKPFIIKDTPVPGIQIADYDNGNSSYTFNNADIHVYISQNALTGTYDLATLSTTANSGVKELATTDYTVDAYTDAEAGGLDTGNADGRGFKVTITGSTLKNDTKGAIADSTASPAVKDTMENEYIYVTFKARITPNLKRTYDTVDAHKTYTDLDKDAINGVTLPDVSEETGTTDEEKYAAYMTRLGITPNSTEQGAIKAIKESESVNLGETGGSYAAKLNELYLRAYLALKAKNDAIDTANASKIDGNGNKNKATLDFGNDFSTGLGNGNSEDTVKVFSVDLDLDKKVKKELIKDDPDHTGEYIDDIGLNPVAGAVFKLVKIDESTGGNSAEILVDYAISDAKGNLKIIKNASQSTAPVFGHTVKSNTEVKFTDNTAANKTEEQTYYMTTYNDGTDDYTQDAWIELTKGQYKIYEVFAPAGYKSWPSTGVTFTVDAKNDGATTPEFTGEFGATGGSDDQFYDLRTQAEKDATEPAVAKYYFKFDNTKGELDGTILNQYDDKLPATGGIGTVLFTAGGISIVLIAGALFVMYMKKRNAEDEE